MGSFLALSLSGRPPRLLTQRESLVRLISRTVPGGRFHRRALSINPQAFELVHIHLRSSGTEYGSRRAQAMTQQPAKRIPQWLTIDLLVIVVSLAIIGIFTAID